MDFDDFTVRQLVELDACTRCGLCIEWCSTCLDSEDRVRWPREKIQTLRSIASRRFGVVARLFGSRTLAEGTLTDLSRGLYDCTLCARCAEVCPVGIDTRSLWLAGRRGMVRDGLHPEFFNHLRETVMTTYNISGDNNEDRLIWSENMEYLPAGVVGKEKAETVYFMGCTPSFYPQTYGILQAAVQVMETAGLDYTTLGSNEWCCGYPLIIAGMGDAVKELVAHNVAAIREKGASRIVAGCPSCYHTWLHDYPQIMGEPLGFEVLHLTQLLEQLISDGRIKMGEFPRAVTYHDPCDLGRNSGIYDAPRQVIGSIPGIIFSEMEENRQYALCCGGGGDVAMCNEELVHAVARRRLRQAEDTGAHVLLSACQQCKRTFMAAVRQEKIRMRVLDIVELVASVMDT